jgi:hypothetical protein
MRLIKMFFFILPSVLIPGAFASTISKATVLVCYGRLDPASIKGYSCVILEPEHYTSAEVRQIKSQNEKVLAYISLGEVNANAKHYPLLQHNTLGKNKIWDSYYLNLKSPETSQILMKIIGDAIDNGYDGFFLDNLDNYTIWGPQKDQKEQVVALLKSIFDKYPHYTFLQNAGLDLIPETSEYVDGIVIESIATNYTFNDKKYKLRDESDYEKQAERLKDIKNTYNLPVTLIEYADTTALRDAVEKRIKNLGFDYFIGNINLQTIPQFSN